METQNAQDLIEDCEGLNFEDQEEMALRLDRTLSKIARGELKCANTNLVL